MPASTMDPISAVLKTSFHGGATKNASIDDKMDGSLKKSLLAPIQFDAPVRHVPALSSDQRTKYIVLSSTSSAEKRPGGGSSSPQQGGGGGGAVTKVDQVPAPRVCLYPRENVQLGYKNIVGPGAGMINMGNTCYLNSTLQVRFINVFK